MQLNFGFRNPPPSPPLSMGYPLPPTTICFNTMFRKKRKFLPTYLYLVGNLLLLCVESSAFRNSPNVLALGFLQLLHAQGNSLKFHINVEGLKNS